MSLALAVVFASSLAITKAKAEGSTIAVPTVNPVVSTPAAPVAPAPVTPTPVAVKSELAIKVIDNVVPIVSDAKEDPAVPSAQESYIEKPFVADTVITQDQPVKPATVQVALAQTTVSAPKPQTTAYSQAKRAKAAAEAVKSGKAHKFPAGWCTYYVAQKRFVPWGGNAISWLTGAKSYGFATGKAPQVGAIMVTNEGSRAGHVAYVEEVSGNEITVSEMNYKGFGVVSKRTLPASSRFILGFVY